MIRIELTGLRNALKDLKKIKDRTRRLKVMKKAIRAAGRVLLSSMRGIIKAKLRRSGNLLKATSTRLRYYRKSDILVLMVGIKSWVIGDYKGRKTVSHKYAHLAQKGHKAFTQIVKVQPGKRYMIKGSSGLVVVSNRSPTVIQLRRRIGAAKGENFVESVTRMQGNVALRKAEEVLQKELASTQ